MDKSNIDKSNMREVILEFPKQFEEALKFSKNIKINPVRGQEASEKTQGKQTSNEIKGNFENIIVCGMGGSALSANILIYWLNELGFAVPPIYIHRDYNLPSFAKKKSLIITISYSGNTEEPITVLREAIKRKIKVAAIATDGKIEKICQKNNIPMVKIPAGIQPRSALGYQFTALAKILMNSGIIKDMSKEISELAKELRKTKFEQIGKKTAKKLKNKIPIVYASNKFKCLARIWKIKFNENSKIPAFYNYFPELNHNEMVGFTQKDKISKFHIIILRDKQDHLKNLKRMKLFSELVKNKGIDVDFFDIKGKSFLSKIFSTLVLGDWISYYLALEYKIDPTPVKIVEEFKKKLKE